MRLGAERKAAEKGSCARRKATALTSADFGGVGQMMPLLIAVAIAMARLLADSFWIAWVT